MKRFLRSGCKIAASTSVALLVGCSGDTGGGPASDVDPTGGVFVSGDSTTGTIKLVPNSTTIAVGEVVGYRVFVKDAAGRGVPNVQVALDSEVGLAIVEPTRGFELTNEDGMLSGKVGCATPGSLTMVARLPVGGNRRDFAEFICSGNVPAGFAGFPGAAGGGLGGGVQVGDGGTVGGTNPDGVRITSVVFQDDGTAAGSSSNASIDTSQNSCVTDTTSTPEPFFDTYASLTVKNNSNTEVRFSKVSYSVDNADGVGAQVNSKDISLVGISSSTVSGSGAETTLTIPVFNAAGGRKYFAFANASEAFPIPLSLGFRNITFRLTGVSSTGDPVTLTGRVTASFGTFNRCAAG